MNAKGPHKFLTLMASLGLALGIGALGFFGSQSALDYTSALSLDGVLEGQILQIETPETLLAQEDGEATITTASYNLSPESLKILFPVTGSKYPALKAVVGEIFDKEAPIDHVLVRVYNDNVGKYFDGTGFNSDTLVELKATGTHQWIYVFEGGVDPETTYFIAARAVLTNGDIVDFPEKVQFDGSDEPTGDLSILDEDLDALKSAAEEDTVDRASFENALTSLVSQVPDQELSLNTTDPVVVDTTTTTESFEVVSDYVCSTPEGQLGAVPSEIKDFFVEICGDPLVMQNVLQVTNEQTYNAKLKEYTGRNLLPASDPDYNTIGMRDSDDDGLSDKEELLYNTDPFHWDSDRDGFKDGEEVHLFGTDPTNERDIPGRQLIITNIEDNMRTKDVKPMIVGSSAASATVKIYEMGEDGSKGSLIASGKADSQGKFAIEPFQALAKGEHLIAALEEDPQGNTVAQSSSVFFIIDPDLDLPPPIVERITTEALRPNVYGSTIFGATVVAHFNNQESASSVVADTTDGRFVVTSSDPMEVGTHTVTLYATLPNGVRSEKVIVPFTIGADGGVNMVGLWSILAIAGLLMLPLLLWGLWYLLHKRDFVLFSAEKSEIFAVENEAKAGHYTYTSKLPFHPRDLKAQYIGFFLNGWGDQAMRFRDFTAAKEGYISAFGKIEEIIVAPADGSKPADITLGEPLPDNLEGARVTYGFTKIDKDPIPYEEFAGKQHIPSKKILEKDALKDDMELEESTDSLPKGITVTSDDVPPAQQPVEETPKEEATPETTEEKPAAEAKEEKPAAEVKKSSAKKAKKGKK